MFVVVNAQLGFDSELIAAFYGTDQLRFLAPTFIGDTVHAETEIIELQDKDDGHGVVTIKLHGVNQHCEVVMTCEFKLLVRKERLIS